MSTRELAVVVASCVLAGTVAAVLPVLWERGGLVAITAIAIAAAVLPVALLVVVRRHPAPGHSSSGRAVRWLPSGDLACANLRWAAQLAQISGSAPQPCSYPERPFSAWMMASAVVAVVATPAFYWTHRPLLRVVNLSEATITVLMDGRSLARLEPTSVENAAAGITVRVPAGSRRLQSVSLDGRHLSDAHVTLRGGRQHLYAPGSGGYCFWVETTGYGQERAHHLLIEPLVGPERFWVLPEIDTWFAPNPTGSDQDGWSTGGIRTALRQARCSNAPSAVREAASPP